MWVLGIKKLLKDHHQQRINLKICFKISIKQGKHVVQALKQKTEEARTQNLPTFHTTLSQNSFPPSEKERKERKTISTRQTQWLTSISPPLKKAEAGSS